MLWLVVIAVVDDCLWLLIDGVFLDAVRWLLCDVCCLSFALVGVA